jgi:hypothetical protein
MKSSSIRLFLCLVIIVQQVFIAFLIFGNNSKNNVTINRRPGKKSIYNMNSTMAPLKIKTQSPAIADDKPCVNINSECRAYYYFTTVIPIL